MITTQPIPQVRQTLHPFAFLRDLTQSCFALAACAFLFYNLAHAQGSVPLVTVATDQTTLNLSNQFGVPAGTAINQAGDFAFVGNGDSALFLRAAGASSATRLLQIEDEAPGFPGSKIVSFEPYLAMNSSRVLLFGITFNAGSYLSQSALLTYDGANYRTVVKTGDAAPGSGGASFGVALIPGSINDAGDINFAGVPVGKSAITFYIIPSGGAAVRIAALDDTPPATCTWCVSSSGPYFYPGIPIGGPLLGGSYVPALNAEGQMLLELWGGLFIGSKDGGFSLVPMASAGACSPQPLNTLGTSPSPPPPISGFLNDSGVVVFTNPSTSGNVAICVAPAGGAPPTAAIVPSVLAPASLGGTILSPLALAFDDSGDIAFQAGISGGTVSAFALLRYHQSTGQTDVIAYNCEAAPGTNGATFSPAPCLQWGGGTIVTPGPSDFAGVSMAKDGSVSFRASLSNSHSGVYRQSAGNLPELIFLGQEASLLLPPLPVGLSIFSPAVPTKILDNGSVLFATNLTSGAADFAMYLGTSGNLQTLMSTADTLPAGARTILLSTPPKASGHFIAFTAQPAAGRRNLMLADTSSTPAVITRVVSDNDPVLATAGGTPGNTIISSNFFLNDGGQIAFETVASSDVVFGTSVIGFGSSTNPAWDNFTSNCGSIFLWSPSSGLVKVATAGDTAPGSTTKFSCVTLNSGPPSPLNQSGQVAFISPSPLGPPVPCLLVCGIPPPTVPSVNGVFVYTPGGAIHEIVAANDTLPGETQPTSFVPDLSIPVNSSGQVAVGAQMGTSSQGLFIRKADTTTQNVMANGDAIPNSATTFGAPHFISGLTDDGNLAFSAATSSAADGLFFAPAGGPIQTIAVDGGAAPGGGTFSLVPQVAPGPGFIVGSLVKNLAATNNESDVAFGALVNGGSANSGYFRVMHGGTLQAIVLQGQAAPGGGTFNTIPVLSSLGANFALGPDGAFAFVNTFTVGSGFGEGLFVARPDGTLIRVLALGDTVQVGGVLTGLSFVDRSAAGDAGKFAFLGRIEGGTAREAIFVTAIPAGTASAAVALGQSQTAAVSQQPVTLTAMVTKTASVSGTPTGTVTFFSNGVSLGTGALSNGQATLTTSSLPAGANSLVAQYDGDSQFASANSLPLAEVVVGFAQPPSSLTVSQGQSLTIPLTLFAPTGSNMSFMLSCSGLPANTACSFDPNPVTPTPTGTMVNLKLTTMAGSKLPARPDTLPSLPRGFGFLAALILATFFWRIAWLGVPRLRLALSTCLTVFALALVLAGCGATGSGSSNPTVSSGTPKGPASFTVTGTSGMTAISTTVQVTVQ